MDCGGSGEMVVVGFRKVTVCGDRSGEDSSGRFLNKPTIFSTRLKVKDCLHSWEHLSLETKESHLRPLVLMYFGKGNLSV